jgi:hypothetical protein
MVSVAVKRECTRRGVLDLDDLLEGTREELDRARFGYRV